MATFTKTQRQEIVREFALRHNGSYNPKLFIDEVQRVGAEHPAYEWFTWDRDKAAYEHNLWQARAFAEGLKVTFTVEEVGRSGKITVRQTSMPLVMSPVAGRKDGGGYLLSDPNDPEHLAELCRQAAQSLMTWLSRYEAALTFAGVPPTDVEALAGKLTAKAPAKALEAAE